MADETPQSAASETTDPTASGEQAAKNPSGKPTMAVKIYAPFQVYFEGEAYSISAVNDVGPFDILPRHHNFLCMLVPCTLTVQTLDGKKDIKIHRALMNVKADKVSVFVDV
jgi:F0F1-type ATP synthase epsilon subunit